MRPGPSISASTPWPALVATASLLSLSLPAAAQPDPADKAARVAELIKQGDELYARRSSDKVSKQALAAYLGAVKLDSKSYEANWKTAKAYFWLADNTEDEARDKDLGWRGYSYARSAISLAPDKVEGHFFAALCIGEYSKGLGIITALRQGIEKKFRGELDRVFRIDRGYDDGGADRAYGNFWHLVPWPKKDNDKAIEHFKKALTYNKDFPRTYFYLARVYLDESKPDLARQALARCLSINPNQGNKMDNYRYQWHCKQLKKEKGL